MSTISKFLAIAALVGGVGGALASQGSQENPCQTPLTQGYEKINSALPNPTESPENEPNMNNIGQFEADFLCEAQGQSCHWVYEAGSSPSEPGVWTECPGTRTNP